MEVVIVTTQTQQHVQRQDDAHRKTNGQAGAETTPGEDEQDQLTENGEQKVEVEKAEDDSRSTGLSAAKG